MTCTQILRELKVNLSISKCWASCLRMEILNSTWWLSSSFTDSLCFKALPNWSLSSCDWGETFFPLRSLYFCVHSKVRVCVCVCVWHSCGLIPAIVAVCGFRTMTEQLFRPTQRWNNRTGLLLVTLTDLSWQLIKLSVRGCLISCFHKMHRTQKLPDIFRMSCMCKLRQPKCSSWLYSGFITRSSSNRMDENRTVYVEDLSRSFTRCCDSNANSVIKDYVSMALSAVMYTELCTRCHNLPLLPPFFNQR